MVVMMFVAFVAVQVMEVYHHINLVAQFDAD